MGKKLIEVALPMDAINDASAYDKMPGIGAHPKGIHYYPARLPLPAARSILFASIIDDPSTNTEKFPTIQSQEKERERLFGIIKNLCEPKIHTKPNVIENAISEIKDQCKGKLPIIHDPFCGGGSIPLEGMRFGMDVIASDLNPISVLLNKATVELLPKISQHPPINPESAINKKAYEWGNAKGLVEDLLYYGELIHKRAEQKLRKYYPKVNLQDGTEVNVLTYIWARTVKCPNPACGCETPLVKSFTLRAKKKNPVKLSFEPIVERTAGNKIIGYKIVEGTDKIQGTIKGNKARCVACPNPMTTDYIKEEGTANRIGNKLVAMVVDYGRGKKYIGSNDEQEKIALNVPIEWSPDFKMSDHPQYMAPPRFGYITFKDLFTNRQLLSLTTLSELVKDLHSELIKITDQEYVDLLILYLLFSVDRLVDYNCNLSTWVNTGEQQKHLFTANRIAMAWDYTEANVIGTKAICWINAVKITAEAVSVTLNKFCKSGIALQKNAEISDPTLKDLLISTDPPYYNNIPYADLMDFFYVWTKHNCEPYFPDVTKTLLTPKAEELVANEFRFDGDKEKAKDHFENGFKKAFTVLKNAMDDRFPMTIYYAFKQQEDEEESEESETTNTDEITLTTGWETILEAVVQSGFQITATWPLRASQKWRMRAMKSNALASYIVMACRKRDDQAQSITKRQYIQEVKNELPKALTILQRSNLAPVDLAQAAIGSGMGIFSKYNHILEQDGTPMRVRTALSLINKTLDEIISEQEGDFDTETRWALTWYEQFGFNEKEYGIAEALSRAKGTAVNALVDAGIVKSGGGKVKLLSRSELPKSWNPEEDRHLVIWETTQYLIKELEENGEDGAARLFKALGAKADVARELSYRLFTICEKKGWAQEAIAYNSLVLSWGQIATHSQHITGSTTIQTELTLE